MTEERTPRMSSVLGETAIVIGNVDGTGDLEIRGRVQGSVTLNGRLLISETGVVLGTVEATNITVAGEVRGDLTAEDGVEIQALGRVEGNIEAPRVGIEAGARVRGMLRTGGELASTDPEKKFRPKNRKRRPHRSDSAAQSSAPEVPEAAGTEPPSPPVLSKNQPRERQGAPDDRSDKSRPDERQKPPEVRPEKTRPLERQKPPEERPESQSAGQRPANSSANQAETRKITKAKKPRRHKGGPPALPTFVKGARVRAK